MPGRLQGAIMSLSYGLDICIYRTEQRDCHDHLSQNGFKPNDKVIVQVSSNNEPSKVANLVAVVNGNLNRFPPMSLCYLIGECDKQDALAKASFKRDEEISIEVFHYS